MVSLAQMAGCRNLEREHLRPLQLPRGLEAPIPGLILFCSKDHSKLEMLLPDGHAVDLLAVYYAAEECARAGVLLENSALHGKLREALLGRNVGQDDQVPQ